MKEEKTKEKIKSEENFHPRIRFSVCQVIENTTQIIDLLNTKYLSM